MARRRSEIVLAALAAGDPEARFDPVRMQKFFFLIDREIPELIDGPHFDFEPYDYGPFDAQVYEELDALVAQGDVDVDTAKRYRRYSPTEAGCAKGTKTLDEYPKPASRYMRDVARWIRSVSFRQLLATIYRQYPEMAAKSIVPHLASGHPRAEVNFPRPSFLSGMARTLDFMGTLDEYRSGMSHERLDALAVSNDWRAVGDDIEAALRGPLAPKGVK